MARRRLRTLKGREMLRGPRMDVRRIGPKQRISKPPFEPVYVDGKPLNEPESKIYRALEDLNINFSAQAVLGGGRELGGALADFVLYDYGIALEYQGPFHNSDYGQAQDFWRMFNRQQAGLTTVYIYEQDLNRLHDRLLEIIGRISRGRFA